MYTHRLTHRKRVTSELHDSYFHLMTIKHAISKIEWAIEWTLNYYITQSLFEWQYRWRRGIRRDVVGKAIPGRWGFGPWWVEVQRRCWWDAVKKAISQQSGPQGLRLSIWRTERYNANGHKSGGQNIAVSVRSPTPSHTRTLSNLFEPLQ